MPRIGVTGHSNLAARSVPLVANGVRAVLAGHVASELVGVTCLARGADQVGGPSGGHSGTADVVDAARGRGMPVTVVWPAEARRD